MPKNSTATSRSLYPAVIAATATVLLAFAATPAVGQVADTKDPESRDESVVDAMLEAGGLTRSQAESDGRDFQVNVFNEDSEAEWAFGSSVVTAPDVDGEYPDGWMFLAHWDGGEWLVGLHGDQQFQELSDAAPDDVLSSGEKENFDAYYEMPEHPSKAEAGPEATTSYTTELRLPYATGQSWKYTGGPHGSPRASVDLAGGDGRVLAAGSGKVYVMCSSRTGWLRVYHPNGYTSDYYHLHNNIKPGNGSSISEGAFLGDIGVDVSCGGGANGAHVHWSILKGDSRTGWHLRSAGKWIFYNGSAEYQGYAMHGSTRVNVGGTLYNYGRHMQNQGIVDTFGGGTLNKRSGPGTNHPVVGKVNDGETVTMSCYHPGGTSHTGRWETTDVWDKLSDGTWISDAFVYSGMVYVGSKC